ncbi:hypothetical protein [Actinoplanes sp. NBRC 103695]|uniref:phosphorylase family protein n=1 Tax=Actinoplanes sp. NBRC 103695 TaxID=3032202 RepID=UPI0024A5A40C|nr:hypothetical protein [Actinoplanes sp. NBRC 103695]GLY98400.1 hypothetical protein Acsp02_56540 [Actinoplanes sp. NBRC 103695]
MTFPHQRVDVVVLTLLDQEIRAVRAALRQMYDHRESVGGWSAWLPAPGGRPIRVAAVRSAGAYRPVIEECRPAVVLLVGIAGGVRPGIEAGDVVLSNEVITGDGGSPVVSAALGRRLDDFFAAVPSEQLRSGEDSYRVYRGPVGAGDFAEFVRADAGQRGWLVVRGIAGPADGHQAHAGVAARHAAEVMAMLLPHLGFDRSHT